MHGSSFKPNGGHQADWFVNSAQTIIDSTQLCCTDYLTPTSIRHCRISTNQPLINPWTLEKHSRLTDRSRHRNHPVLFASFIRPKLLVLVCCTHRSKLFSFRNCSSNHTDRIHFLLGSTYVLVFTLFCVSN